MSGIERITKERERQVKVEGWTPRHDATHFKGALAIAAFCYARTASKQLEMNLPVVPVGPVPYEWPWEPCWWKPSADPIRNLEKAGALIAAEIDRLEQEG